MTDPIFKLIASEKLRQEQTLMMIPSENYTYPDVLSAVGSVLMQKYAEGLPGKRYYQGNEYVDKIERLCQQRALATFGLDKGQYGVNVQPWSGSIANLAALNALLNPGDKILSLELTAGGHLSHGWHTAGKKISFVSKVYDVHFYTLNPNTQLLDYDAIEKLSQEIKPRLIISGGTAYPREIDYTRLSQIAKSVGAYYLADVAHEAGLIAGGALSSPFPHADIVTMTTHKTLRGPRGALIFAKHDLMDKINASVFPGLQGGPHLHTIAGIAVALARAKSKEFKHYAHQTVRNAKTLASELTERGFNLVSLGTDKHLLLLDLRNKNVSGFDAANLLETVGIITNRNTIPFDTASAFYPSGLRLGTQALTVRGLKEPEIKLVADWIDKVISGRSTGIAKQVRQLCRHFPVPIA